MRVLSNARRGPVADRPRWSGFGPEAMEQPASTTHHLDQFVAARQDLRQFCSPLLFYLPRTSLRATMRPGRNTLSVQGRTRRDITFIRCLCLTRGPTDGDKHGHDTSGKSYASCFPSAIILLEYGGTLQGADNKLSVRIEEGGVTISTAAVITSPCTVPSQPPSCKARYSALPAS